MSALDEMRYDVEWSQAGDDLRHGRRHLASFASQEQADDAAARLIGQLFDDGIAGCEAVVIPSGHTISLRAQA